MWKYKNILVTEVMVCWAFIFPYKNSFESQRIVVRRHKCWKMRKSYSFLHELNFPRSGQLFNDFSTQSLCEKSTHSLPLTSRLYVQSVNRLPHMAKRAIQINVPYLRPHGLANVLTCMAIAIRWMDCIYTLFYEALFYINFSNILIILSYPPFS